MMQQPIFSFDGGGNKIWQLNSKLHREDGPAVESTNGDKYWYYLGVRHRADGPATEYVSGHKSWYYNGRGYDSLSEFCDAAKITGEEKTIFLLKWA